MSNFVGIVTEDPAVRNRFLSSAEGSLSPFEGLLRGQQDFGKMSLVWAAPPTVPISSSHVPPDTFSFVLGQIKTGKVRSDAAHFLAEEFVRTGSGSVSSQNGYYAAVALRGKTVVLGSDVLGLYPLYYFSTPDLLAFSSAPFFLLSAPGFQKALDAEALVLLLLLGVIPGGRTLLKGLRRLSPGHVFEWQQGLGGSEIPACPITPTDRYFGNSFDKNLEIVDGLLSQAVRDGLSHGEATMLLSGGLDSRLLAGYIAEIRGQEVFALTQGRDGDIETHCARRVADELHWRHSVVSDDPSLFGETALLKLNYEYLCGGYDVTPFPQLIPLLCRQGTSVVSGAYGDSVLGDQPLDTHQNQAQDFNGYFEYYNELFFKPEEIGHLVRREVLGDAVLNGVDRLRDQYTSCPGSPFQKTWRFDLTIDALKVVFPRYISFGAWPILPYTDGELIEAVSGMPAEHLAARRMQREILCRRFPRLAALPLDRNAYGTAPALGLRDLFGNNGLSAVGKIRALAEHAAARGLAPAHYLKDQVLGVEKRFYYRALDFRQAGWQQLQNQARLSLARLEPWFDRTFLEHYLGTPNEAFGVKDALKRFQRAKLLVGLALWVEQTFLSETKQ